MARLRRGFEPEPVPQSKPTGTDSLRFLCFLAIFYYEHGPRVVQLLDADVLDIDGQRLLIDAVAVATRGKRPTAAALADLRRLVAIEVAAGGVRDLWDAIDNDADNAVFNAQFAAYDRASAEATARAIAEWNGVAGTVGITPDELQNAFNRPATGAEGSRGRP